MKRQETPLPPPPPPQPQQPPPSLPPYFFTPPQNPQVLPENMDWAIMLLSCPTVPASMEAAAGTSSTTFSQNSSRAEDQDYDRHKDKRRTGRSRKTATRPRVEFQTRSTEDILDDGYRWRKYGQKSVKNSNYPRSYYRCTHITCNVKKQVQRLSNDTGIVVTTYEGIHNHPCEKLMETLSPLLRQMQFLARF